MKIVIGSKNCPECEKTKKELINNNENFKYKDIKELTEKELEEITEKFGTHLPIIYKEKVI